MKMSTLSGPHSANLHSAENQTDLYPSRINQEPMILKREDPVVYCSIGCRSSDRQGTDSILCGQRILVPRTVFP